VSRKFLRVIADASQVASIGALYWPGGTLFAYGDPAAGCLLAFTQIVMGVLASAGGESIVVNYSLVSVPPQGYSQLSQ